MDLRLLFQITRLCSVGGKSFQVIWKVRRVSLDLGCQNSAEVLFSFWTLRIKRLDGYMSIWESLSSWKVSRL